VSNITRTLLNYKSITDKTQTHYKCITFAGDRLTDEELEDILQSIDLDVDYEGNIKYEGRVDVMGQKVRVRWVSAVITKTYINVGRTSRIKYNNEVNISQRLVVMVTGSMLCTRLIANVIYEPSLMIL
jgi:hypothetical protein